MKNSIILSTLVLLMVAGCQPSAADPTDEALTAEPTVEVEAQPTATTAPDPTATRTAAPTEFVPTLAPGMVGTLDPSIYAFMDGCAFLPPDAGESVIGVLTQPAWTEQVYSDFDARFITGCYYLAEANTLTLRVWVADSEAEAQADYALWRDFAADDAISIDGLGDAAIWWPGALRLDVLHHNMRLWIAFEKPVEDTANSAARLASLSLPMVDPTLGSLTPPQVAIPADAPQPETIRDLSQEPEFFDACSLASADEFAALVGPLDDDPIGGGSIGEMVGYFYDCSVSGEAVSVSYTINVSSPSAAINLFLRNDRERDPAATVLPLEAGDRAVMWQPNEYEIHATVLRGNALLTFGLFGEAASEFEQRLRDLITLTVDRLFEGYSADGG